MTTPHADHSHTQDMKPDLDEVLQLDTPPELTAIPVTISEPVEARELPSKRIAPRTVTLDFATAGQLLSRDPRRKQATLIARTQDILIGANQSQAGLTGAWIPGTVPFVVTSVAELWGIGNGAGTDVTVIEEYWA